MKTLAFAAPRQYTQAIGDSPPAGALEPITGILYRGYRVRLAKSSAWVLVAALTLAAPAAVQANLYGVSMPTRELLQSNLYQLNEATGAATFIAPLAPGFTSYSGAAFLAGLMYVTDVFIPPGPYDNGWFGSLDTTTGVFTPICDQDGSMNWVALAADQDAGLMYTIDWDDNFTLKSVTAAGTVTSIGTGTGVSGVGMAFDNVNDILYAVDFLTTSLYTLNTATGTSTLIGSLGLTPYTDDLGLDYDDAAGILYANTLGSLYTVDVTTGAATLVGSNGVPNVIEALAWLGETPQAAIPEPGTLALLGLGALGLLRRRRRAS